MTSSPIKGTLPRSADPAALRASVKDVAENIMIVDLVRNDLSRVAVTGTRHRARTARGAARSGRVASGVDGVRADAGRRADGRAAGRGVPARVRHRYPEDPGPPPAVRLGALRRGVYCGTVGLASPVAGCELNVAIRTVEFGTDGSAVLGVGGGITADSDPDREWEECLHKAAPIVGATRTAGSVRRGSLPAVAAR